MKGASTMSSSTDTAAKVNNNRLIDGILVLSGSVFTNLGNSMYVVALFTFLSLEYPRPLFIGLIQSTAFLPIVLFSTAAGRMADRSYRPWIIAGSDILRALFFLAAAALLAVGRSLHPMLILLPMVFLNGIMQAGFNPAVISYMLDLGRGTGRMDLLSLRTGSAHLSSLGGQSIGALLYSLAGLTPMLLCSALGFLISGISELFLSDPGRKRYIQLQAATSAGPRRLLDRSVLDRIMGIEGRGGSILLFIGLQAVNSMLIVNLPFYITRRLEFPPEFLGFAMASLFGGSIAIGLIHGVSPRVRNIGPAMPFTFMTFYAILILLVSIGSMPAAIYMILLLFAGVCLSLVYLRTIHSAYALGGGKDSAATQGLIDAMGTAVLPAAYLINALIASLFPLDSPWILRIMAAASIILVLWRYRVFKGILT